jgi:5-methylcytosine-specific restriction protein A
VAVAMDFVVATVESEATADSQTKPKTEQATETGTMPPKAEAEPEEAAQGAASHEGSHADYEGSHAEEEIDEGSH